jgi:protease PrsW
MNGSMTASDFVYALLSGMLPALLWLWFWLREDNLHPEPRSVLTKAFIGGMFAVILVLPFQKMVQLAVSDSQTQYILWASFEELFKLFVAYIFGLKSRFMDEPIDALIYMVTVALGFAALENTFFILDTLQHGGTLPSVITGNMRFIGASLVHVVSSGSIGFFIGLAFYRSHLTKLLYMLVGLVVGTTLHSAFNLFIIRANALDTLKIFGCVWLGVVILMILFEEIKAVKPRNITN